MANLITGLDWIDHAMIPKREPSKPVEEKSEADSSDEESQDEGKDPRVERRGD